MNVLKLKKYVNGVLIKTNRVIQARNNNESSKTPMNLMTNSLNK